MITVFHGRPMVDFDINHNFEIKKHGKNFYRGSFTKWEKSESQSNLQKKYSLSFFQNLSTGTGPSIFHSNNHDAEISVI